MMTCLPVSLCSPNYRVIGAAGGQARLEFATFGEQGQIRLGDAIYKIVKRGMLSGRWSLEGGGQIWVEAHKPSAFSRRFDVRASGMTFRLQPQSVFGRSFKLLHGHQRVGIIEPAHAFTRRAVIRCGQEVPELAQLFSFWLVALLWRRAQRRSNS